MRLLVDVLDIEEHKVGDLQKLVKRASVRILLCGEGCGGGIEAGMHALGFEAGKQFGEEGKLQHGLAARRRHAALGAEIALVFEGFFDGVFHRNFPAAANLPGVGIVAVLAAHRAALKEDDEADARTVDRAE